MLWLIALCVLLAGLLGSLAWLTYARRTSAAEHEAEVEHWRRVAEEVGGLTLSQTSSGRPRLRGNVAGIEIEIDGDNHFDRGFEGLLGLRASVPFARQVPEGMVGSGPMPPVLVERFGPPRALGDGDALALSLHVREDRETQGWWQDPQLAHALLELHGAAFVLLDGQLTVLFDHLDGDSVRTALRIPPLLRDAVERPTVH